MRHRAILAVAATSLLAGCSPLHVTTPSGFGFRKWSDTGSIYDSVTQRVQPPACPNASPSWRLRVSVEELRQVEVEANALNVWEGREVAKEQCKRIDPDLGGAFEFFDTSRRVRLPWRRCTSPDPKYDALLAHVNRLLQRMYDKDRDTNYGCVFL